MCVFFTLTIDSLFPNLILLLFGLIFGFVVREGVRVSNKDLYIKPYSTVFLFVVFLSAARLQTVAEVGSLLIRQLANQNTAEDRVHYIIL